MRDIVHKIDPTAYITISEVADVYKANQNAAKNKAAVKKDETSEN